MFGSNGVIQKAQDSKKQTEIGEMREKLEMAKVPVYADGNGSYKVQDYWDRIESEGLIADKTVDIIDNGDGTYEVTTTPGYVFEITVEPNKEIAENVIIGECIGKGENLSIGIRVVKKTTNSIEIEVVRAEGASNFKYSIKKQGEEYGAAEEKSETRHVFSGLTQGGIYTIKVEATKDGEQQIVEKTVQVGEIPLAIEGDVIWKTGQAEVRIYTNETGYQLEWQKNGISEGSWTRETSGVKEKTITGLVNGDIIYARLYDGTSTWDNVSGQGKWNVHPAFNYGQEVSGIWVAKFEASPEGATTSTSNSEYNGTGKKLQVKPGVSSWRSITISNIYDVCKNYNSALNSHMMKNDEWGAVAYLSKSEYGKQNEEVWINNSSSYITGSAGNSASASSNTGTTNDYTSTQGVKASTTGTVYGVYDMSGGAWEYVAGYVNNGNSSLTSYGSSLVNGAAKTKNVYSKASTDNNTNNYNANSSKYGDAVYETSTSGSGSTSWYGDYSYFPDTSYPFFGRGGDYDNGTNAGVFCFNGTSGNSYSDGSFRPVLVAL